MRNLVIPRAGATAAIAILVLGIIPANRARAQSYPTSVLAANPVEYYRLGETSGTTAVNSATTGAVNNGTLNGTVMQGVSGAIVGDSNTAYSFSSTSPGNVSLPRAVSGDFSLEFWFNTTSNDFIDAPQWYNAAGLVDMEVAGVTDDFGTALSGGTVLFGVGNPDVTIRSTSTSLNDGAWHYVVAERTQSTGLMSLYIDGALQVTSTGTSTNTGLLNASSVMRIGNLQTQVGQYTGKLDEVAIYDTNLSTTQIADHYRVGLGGAASAPEPTSATMALIGALPLLSGTIARRRTQSRTR